MVCHKQNPRLSKENKQYKKSSDELQDKFKNEKEEESNIPEDIFKLYSKPLPNDILRCANKILSR